MSNPISGPLHVGYSDRCCDGMFTYEPITASDIVLQDFSWSDQTYVLTQTDLKRLLQIASEYDQLKQDVMELKQQVASISSIYLRERVHTVLHIPDITNIVMEYLTSSDETRQHSE